MVYNKLLFLDYTEVGVLQFHLLLMIMLVLIAGVSLNIFL